MIEQEQRHTRRLPVQTPGNVLLDDGSRATFETHDLSINGSCVDLAQDPPPRVGAALTVHFDGPGFGAQASVRWAHPLNDGRTRLGLSFDRLVFPHSHG